MQVTKHSKHIACVSPDGKIMCFYYKLYCHIHVLLFNVATHIFQRPHRLWKFKPCAQPLGHNVSGPNLFTCLIRTFTSSSMIGCGFRSEHQKDIFAQIDWTTPGWEKSRYDPTANVLYVNLEMPMIGQACLLKQHSHVAGTLDSINNFDCWVGSGIVSFSEHFFIT